MHQGIDLLRTVAALGFVLGLIWLLGFIVRKYGWRWGLPTPMSIAATKRLRLVEVMAVDARTKLVLVRRDDVEHLILVGPQQSQLVETNTMRLQGNL